VKAKRDRVLVLDAFGVLYHPGDDVGEVLIPFIAERGGIQDGAKIEALYREASLGRLEAQDFWRAVGLNPTFEDPYLERIQLAPGVHEFLRSARRRFARIACLSNDVPGWSHKLRERHGLTGEISSWLLSSDVGVRKPGAAIYTALLEELGVPGDRVLFVDDRLPNLDAATAFGIHTVWLHPGAVSKNGHAVIQSLPDLLELAVDAHR
jgi:putative hydrolase of the HAD superfamily